MSVSMLRYEEKTYSTGNRSERRENHTQKVRFSSFQKARGKEVGQGQNKKEVGK
jgi:hypothetical protein